MCVMSLIQQEGSEAHTVPLFSFARGETEVQCLSNWVGVTKLHDDYVKALKEMNQITGDSVIVIVGSQRPFLFPAL